LFRQQGSGLIVHGHDTASMIPASLETTTATPAEPTCVSSGNYYAHIIYAYPVDRASRYNSMAEHIRDLVRDNTGRLMEEAGEFGASRRYRVLCNASNQITVSNVGVGVTSLTDFNALTLDLENRGFNAPGVKYWVWFEGSTGPGILGTGHVYDDSSPGVGNLNNGNGQAMFAVLWGDEAGVPQYEATTWMHENGHNMGAVVSDAPNTSGNLHCIDDKDIMCYVDGGARAACCFRHNACIDREHFDCNHDDYFHPSPASGFLTNHWNLGSTNNRFLDATAAISLRFQVSAVTVNEDASSVNLLIDRIGSTTGTVGVTASTSPGTAQAGSDYTHTSQALSFGPGITQRTFTVPLVSDGPTGETNETFTVGLSNPTGGATIGSPSTVSVTVAESAGPPVIQMANASVQANEHDASMTFTVVRGGATGSSVSVSYSTTAGTATPGADYTDVSGTLTFSAGVTTRTFSVPLLDDQTFESNETFAATIHSPTNGATLGNLVTTTATIIETDARPTIALTSSAATVGETAGSLAVTVTRTGATDDPVGATVSTSVGSASTQDFSPVSTSLTFGPGVVTQQISIPIIDDALIEPTETFTVNLSSPTGIAQLGTPSSMQVSILDDDGGLVEVAQQSVTQSETDPLTLQATRTIVQAPASVTWTLTQVQPAGQVRTGTLAFAAGAATASAVIDVNDLIATSDRFFTFTLSNPSGVTIGERRTTTIRVTDDETPPTIGFSASSFTWQENAGTQSVTVERSGNLSSPASVTLASGGGTASTSSDLNISLGPITFASGQASRVVSVNVIDDQIAERAENLTLTLTGASGAAISRGTATLNIAASDQQPDLTLYGSSPAATGNNVYSSNATDQTSVSVAPRAAGPHSASFLVENDGNATVEFRVFAAAPSSATEVRYLIGTNDITSVLTSPVGYVVELAPLNRITIRVDYLPSLTALPTSRRDLGVRATWTGDGERRDTGTVSFVVV
jgi:hypothetical protein